MQLTKWSGVKKNVVVIFGYRCIWSWKLQYSSDCTCLTTVHSVFLHELNISETHENKAVGLPSSFFFLLFHNNEDTTVLAILVYSPRACLWEHHVYCAVLSTSMECNICHRCHSQWRCHFWGIPLLNENKSNKPNTNCHAIALWLTSHSINVSQDLDTWL